MTQEIDISAYLAGIINENVAALKQRALKEKDKQQTSKPKQSIEPKMPDLGDDDEKKSKKHSNTDEEIMAGDVKLEHIVEKLNTIRSGKSFGDSLIEQRFQKYFEELSEAERVALFTFLKGIAQIVTGEVSPEETIEPTDAPANVQIKKTKTDDKQEKSIKPVVISKPEQTKSNNSNQEDTSAPQQQSPIRVKKR